MSQKAQDYQRSYDSSPTFTKPVTANTSSTEVLSTSEDFYCIATLKGFQYANYFRSQSEDYI